MGKRKRSSHTTSPPQGIFDIIPTEIWMIILLYTDSRFVNIIHLREVCKHFKNVLVPSYFQINYKQFNVSHVHALTETMRISVAKERAFFLRGKEFQLHYLNSVIGFYEVALSNSYKLRMGEIPLPNTPGPNSLRDIDEKFPVVSISVSNHKLLSSEELQYTNRVKLDINSYWNEVQPRVCLSPRLEELEINTTNSIPNMLEVRVTFQTLDQFQHLKSLKIRTLDPSFAEHISKTLSCPSLENLSIYAMPKTYKFTIAFCAPRLQHLELDEADDYAKDLCFAPPLKDIFPKLQSFKLVIYNPDISPDRSLSKRDYLCFLRNLFKDHTNLRDIQLEYIQFTERYDTVFEIEDLRGVFPPHSNIKFIFNCISNIQHLFDIILQLTDGLCYIKGIETSSSLLKKKRIERPGSKAHFLKLKNRLSNYLHFTRD